MTERMTRESDWSYGKFILSSAAVAVKGELACFNTATGEVVPGQALTTLIPIGYFTESMTGDGAKLILVRLFQELRLHWWDNDTAPNDVTAAMIGSEVYIKDARTVSALSTGRSKAGRVWAVDSSQGVLIEQGLAVTGPTGPSATLPAGVADRAALKAIAAASRVDGMLVLVRTDNSLWRFNGASTLGDDEADELAQEPDAGAGCWIRADKSFTMKIPFSAALADGATIETIPAGFALRLTGLPFLEVIASFTGGSSSSIGFDCNKSGYDTAGDLLGGAAGDVEANLTAGIRPGTVGAKLDTEAERQALVFIATEVIRYQEITSAFTAGSGYFCLPVSVTLTA